MRTATTKKTRRALVAGAEHTEASLAAMKTSEIAALVAALKGGKPPKPATKAKAIELFWRSAESLPETPEAPKTSEAQDAKAAAPEATAEPGGTGNGASAKARKTKVYAVRIDGAEDAAKVEAMNPLARRLAEGMRAAGRPLSMAECVGIVSKFSKSAKPEKLVAWHFCKLFRPAGVLVESREGRGA